GRDNRALVGLDDTLQRAPLVAPVSTLAIEVEQRGEAHAGKTLDLAIELDEGNAERRRELRAQGRFSRTAQTDERYAPPALVLHGSAEGPGEQSTRLRELLGVETRERLHQEREFHRMIRPLAHQLGERQAHRLDHLAQQDDGDIAVASLELRQIALGNAGVARQDLAGHAAPRPRGPDPQD